MRTVTAEERALFLAALSGRLPAKAARAVAKAVAEKASEPAVTTTPSKTAAKSGRRASDEEVLQFLEAIGLRPPAAIAPAKTPTKPTTGKPTTAKPPAKERRKATGLDGATKRKLEKGEIAPAAKLDLHGLTEAAAHGTLLTFLAAAYARGDRLVLVVTGKGEAGRGILKAMVPRWLAEAPMQNLIADKRWAHRRHGGEGALYVYLHKPNRG